MRIYRTALTILGNIWVETIALMYEHNIVLEVNVVVKNVNYILRT